MANTIKKIEDELKITFIDKSIRSEFYVTNYNERQVLGKGNYGKVVWVKQKSVSKESFAIKKIKINDKTQDH